MGRRRGVWIIRILRFRKVVLSIGLSEARRTRGSTRTSIPIMLSKLSSRLLPYGQLFQHLGERLDNDISEIFESWELALIADRAWDSFQQIVSSPVKLNSVHFKDVLGEQGGNWLIILKVAPCVVETSLDAQT